MTATILGRSDMECPFDLSLLGDDHRADPYPNYKQMRDEFPVFQNADGTYVVTRHADVQKVLTSPDTTTEKSAQFKKTMGEGAIYEFQITSMTTWDPPDHTLLRRLLNRAFTPPAMAQWQPLIVEAVEELLTDFDARGEMDLVGDFAAVLPLTLICKMLGVPKAEKERFRAWANSITTSLEPKPAPGVVQRANVHSEEWKAYFRELIAKRRAEPGTDLISVLLKSDEGDHPFPELVHLHNLALLLSAGHETTTALITNAIDLCFRFPEQVQRLRDDPALIETAVEEFLRYDAPVQMGMRRLTASMVLSDVELPEGSVIWTVQGAANRDERVMADPDTLDLGRKPNRHMAFASGIHTCLGMPLARAEARVALQRLICGYPGLRPNGAPERSLRTRYRGFKSYPVSAG